MGPQKKFLGSNNLFSLANYHQISKFLITLTTITKGKECLCFQFLDAAQVASIPRRIQTHFAGLATLFQRTLKTASH
jgi:hypothetical protein